VERAYKRIDSHNQCLSQPLPFEKYLAQWFLAIIGTYGRKNQKKQVGLQTKGVGAMICRF